MLVSFSMLLLLTVTIIPLYVQMKEAEKKQYVSYQADAILHEELLKYKYEEGYKQRGKIIKENVVFYLKWNGESTQKLCVEWIDSAEKMKKKCDVMLK
jgi:competence protein ComGE